jgi:hypothetical protein
VNLAGIILLLSKYIRLSGYVFIFPTEPTSDMQTKTTLAIFAILGAITLVVAPSLISQASAKQSATITCTQETGSGDNVASGPCSGSSAVNNPNRDEDCTAKNAGQQAKLC